ncbi:MAG: polyamine aminopropyltransferase [Deltaproteobacteria bacterium]|nr:polyamine aminopropyltransferase [Deltaproteobacteria bacterium]
MPLLLLLSVFVISTCGLVYELIAGTLASYLLGDSVTQFSTIIGVYLFSMGIGAYLSKFVQRNFLSLFIKVELLIGLLGGSSAAFLFYFFAKVYSFRILLYVLVLLIGTLVGLEIPLLMRILKDEFEFKDLVSKVFSFDYVGALIASLLFPLVLVPHLGLIRSSFLFGILNVLIALMTLFYFQQKNQKITLLKTSAFLVLLFLVFGFVCSEKILTLAENGFYTEPVIYAVSTPYQRIALTRNQEELRLYLNGHLQFSSRDEYRYHEALVFPGLLGLKEVKKVLVLGGGDGMALREIFKVASVESVTLVDLDQQMTHLFQGNEILNKLNAHSFSNPKVKVINADAFLWLKENQEQFDFAVVDFPDPTNYSLGKLYSLSFYKELYRSLAPSAGAVIQSTSPYFARESFWCVAHTLEAAQFSTQSYHLYVPSFGEWGYTLALKNKDVYEKPKIFPEHLKFLNSESLVQMFQFAPDMSEVPGEINQLNNQYLVRTYEREWAKYSWN